MKLIILFILLAQLEAPWWHYCIVMLIAYGEYFYEKAWRKETQEILRIIKKKKP
jgi:hypothetical protein